MSKVKLALWWPSRSCKYVTLVNPLRDVGPVHVHGLTADDVASAPMFEEIVGDLLEVMRGAVMVAHNIRFERDFVSAEFSAAGVFLPRIPSLCTLELAYKIEPSLLNHRLASCCVAAGVPYHASHTALGDARAEAELLRRYLLRAEADGMATLDAFGCVPVIFPDDDWPDLPRTGRRRARAGDGTGVAVPYLARLVASLGSVQTSEKLAPRSLSCRLTGRCQRPPRITSARVAPANPADRVCRRKVYRRRSPLRPREPRLPLARRNRNTRRRTPTTPTTTQRTGLSICRSPFSYRVPGIIRLGLGIAPGRLRTYMDLLDRVLEDSQVTEAGAGALRATADQWGLSMEDVIAAHYAYLEALVATEVEDGSITGSERRELDAVSHLLAVDSSVLEALLVRGKEDRG